MIDPRADRAIYRQLADILRGDIMSGRLQPGQRLPAEHRLASEYGISRDSVRDAIAVLRSEGLVETQAAYGTIVRDRTLRELVVIPRGASVLARMPTEAERRERDIPEGVPVIEVHQAGGTMTLYRGDAVLLVDRARA